MHVYDVETPTPDGYPSGMPEGGFTGGGGTFYAQDASETGWRAARLVLGRFVFSSGMSTLFDFVLDGAVKSLYGTLLDPYDEIA